MRELYDKIALWLEQGDILYRRFDQLASLLEEFFEQHVLVSKEIAGSIRDSFTDVLKNCDNIDYEQPGQVYAYIILHFLDRYHRFQMILLELLSNRLLPLPKTVVNALDVGTGPAPALFALSDMYAYVQAFGRQANIERLSELRYEPDYVELSQGFRHWLHHFTEFVNWPERGFPWVVPFHHGSFSDFGELNYNRVECYDELDDEGDYHSQERLVKSRFNLVILSNFLTNTEIVYRYEQQLYQSALNLRNRGLLLIAGAPSDRSKKYEQIYESARTIIEGGTYTNERFIGTCQEARLMPLHFDYRYSDKYGTRLKAFRRRILRLFESLGQVNATPPDEYAKFTNTTSDEYDSLVRWDVRTFRKSSRVRRPGYHYYPSAKHDLRCEKD